MSLMPGAPTARPNLASYGDARWRFHVAKLAICLRRIVSVTFTHDQTALPKVTRRARLTYAQVENAAPKPCLRGSYKIMVKR